MGGYVRYLAVIFWALLAVPTILVLVVFAVNNRAPVSFSLAPTPFEVDLPLFLPLYLGILGAFFAGVGLQWIKDAPARRAARRYARERDAARRALAAAQARIDALEAAPPHLPATTDPAPLAKAG